MTYPLHQPEPLLLRDKEEKSCKCPVNTDIVQLKKIRPAPNKQIKSKEDVTTLLKDMEDYDREHAVVLHLNTKNKVIGIDDSNIGTLNASLISPRELAKAAILNNANAVIFVHNHPSGDCTPSQNDKDISDLLEKSFNLLDIKLLDSIIVAKTCSKSRQAGEW